MSRQRLLEVKRDIRYFGAQVERAVVVDPGSQPHDQVHFGASVEIIDAHGKHDTFHIVGDDEADVAASRISWAAPLAKALLGAKVGETVKWQRPAGATDIEIAAISYDVVDAGR